MIGQGNISFSNKPGAPAGFINIAGARNGTSIDSASFVVLGQDAAAVGNPGRLLSDRYMPMMGNAIRMLGSTGANVLVNDDHLEQGGLTSPNAYVYWIGTPNNFGTVYPGHGVADQFYAGWQRFDGVNTYPRPNVVGMYWAYNMGTGGGQVNPAEAAFGFRTETDFDLNAGGVDYFELHLPQMFTQTGLGFRPWSFYTAKNTGATIHQSQVQSFNFDTKNENLTYYSWSCNTIGPVPEGRTMTATWTARGLNGVNPSVTMLFNDQDATFAQGTLMWDRGSWTLGLDTSGTSFNSKTINIIGNVRQTGAATGASIINTFSQSDQLTGMSVQIISATLVNQPFYEFDRRGPATILPDGTNAGELTWNSGGRDMQALGRVNGTHTAVTNCFDFVINGFDTDNVQHDQLIVGRNGNSIFRGNVTTGNPLSGSGAWLLGQFQAAAVVLDTTHYVEVNIDGTVRKLAVVN